MAKGRRQPRGLQRRSRRAEALAGITAASRHPDTLASDNVFQVKQLQFVTLIILTERGLGSSAKATGCPRPTRTPQVDLLGVWGIGKLPRSATPLLVSTTSTTQLVRVFSASLPQDTKRRCPQRDCMLGSALVPSTASACPSNGPEGGRGEQGLEAGGPGSPEVAGGGAVCHSLSYSHLAPRYLL